MKFKIEKAIYVKDKDTTPTLGASYVLSKYYLTAAGAGSWRYIGSFNTIADAETFAKDYKEADMQSIELDL